MCKTRRVRLCSRGLPLVALLGLVASYGLRPMAESDLFFRIKAGQEILARGGLPGRNLYSFTYPDYPDLDASWLFEVGAAALYRWVGFPGLVVAKVIVLAVAFAAAYGVCRRRGAGPVASALALAAAAFVGRERFVERPHLFSLLGAVGLLAAIDALADGPAARARRVGLALVAGVVLWANLHAGVFLAPVALGAAAVAAAGAAAASAAGDRSPAWRRLALAAAAAAAATLATPIGLGLVRYLRLHLVLPTLHPVDEFRAPSWTSDAPLVVYAVAVAVAVAAGLAVVRTAPPTGEAGTTRRRPPLVPLATPVVLAALTLRSVRFAADLALVSAPLLAAALTELGARWRARVPAALGGAAPAVAGLALVAGLAAGPRLARAEGWHIGLDARELPLEAIAFVDANGLRERMYNDFEIGSYLLFDPAAGYPRHRVFVDPRLPAYPPELHALLGRGDLSRGEWSQVMDRYGVETALCAYAGLNRRVAWWDPEIWALVYRQGDARVFVRRLPRYEAVIAAHEIPATFAFSAEEGAATLPLAERPARSPVPDCEWQRRVGDLLFELDGGASARTLAAYRRALAAPAGCLAPVDDARLAAWLGALALGARRPDEALALIDRARSHGDGEVTTLSNRALALEGLGRTSEAAEAWGEIATRAAGTTLGTKARARQQQLANR
jgi:hypothetical protein